MRASRTDLKMWIGLSRVDTAIASKSVLTEICIKF